jgi:hypothetical protein
VSASESAISDRNRLLVEFYRQEIDYGQALATVLSLYQSFEEHGASLYKFIDLMSERELRIYVSSIVKHPPSARREENENEN